jgi:hypothetical protein
MASFWLLTNALKYLEDVPRTKACWPMRRRCSSEHCEAVRRHLATNRRNIKTSAQHDSEHGRSLEKRGEFSKAQRMFLRALCFQTIRTPAIQ